MGSLSLVKAMPHDIAASTALSERSGSITSPEPVVSVFYGLCHSHMPTGLLAEAVKEATAFVSPARGRVAANAIPRPAIGYGLDLARRLRPNTGSGRREGLARCFAFLLERCVPAGVLEELVCAAEQESGEVTFSNGWLARICIELVDMVDRGPST